MPAVPCLSLLLLCTALCGQGPSVASRERVPDFVDASASPESAHGLILPAMSLHRPVSSASAPRPDPATPPSDRFSVPEALVLLLVGTCLVWIGFANRRPGASPPRRVVR